MKYGAKSTDIVRHKGSLMTVTTVNAKGSWTRTLDTEKTLQQVSCQICGPFVIQFLYLCT